MRFPGDNVDISEFIIKHEKIFFEELYKYLRYEWSLNFPLRFVSYSLRPKRTPRSLTNIKKTAVAYLAILAGTRMKWVCDIVKSNLVSLYLFNSVFK